MTLKIYPSLAVGYFILFLMYAEIIFLYYFDDLTGQSGQRSCLPGDMDWQSDCNTFTGDLVWRRGHSRSICRMECGICETAMGRKNMDRHVFCRGNLIPQGKGNGHPVWFMKEKQSKSRRRKRK